jgi:pyruvate/2-oxoacid:ferredoxin oxidoreductase beta subunit
VAVEKNSSKSSRRDSRVLKYLCVSCGDFIILRLIRRHLCIGVSIVANRYEDVAVL